MKVSKCNSCKYCSRRKWITYHEPKGYHAIGITHVYAYCDKYKKRVLDINKCEKENENE